MKPYVYIHPDVKQAAMDSGHLDRIEKLRDRIASTPYPSLLHHSPRPYDHHRFDRNYRLLVERHIHKDAEVMVFRHFWKHDEYDAFSKRQLDDRKLYYRDNITDHQIIADQVTNQQRGDTSRQERLLPSDVSFLNAQPSRYDALESKIVIETNEWCKTIEEWCKHSGNLLVKKMSIGLHNTVADVLDTIESPRQSSSNGVRIQRGEDLSVFYRYFHEWNILMLINVVLNESPKTPEMKSVWTAMNEQYGVTFEDKDTLMQRCRRLYPQYLISGRAEWWEVQSTEKANMVLSSEESRVLESLCSMDSTSARYPLFINGRAGSGKSTILQFLFAGVLDVYMQNQEAGDFGVPPIYITYNKQLLDQAKKSVTEIRESSAPAVGNRTLEIEEQVHTPRNIQLDSCFNTVRDLLRSLLPASKRKKYKPLQYINFKSFRPRWDDQRRRLNDPRAKGLSAGIVWHGIRAYIKGLSIESPEQYSQLPNDRKSISEDNFTLLYNTGWQWYKRICDEEQLWDDQDLALALQQCEDAQLSHFPAIFCDEAQDFTSVELKLLQRLSRYSSYHFANDQSYLVRKIPFAFSGDPFQTLNPTGFKWGNIMAMYFEDLKHRRGPESATSVKLNYHELSRNYRSVSGIIKLSNSIQLIRCLLTNETKTKPQYTRDALRGAEPQGFILDEQEQLVESRIRESKELFIIVPCEDGEEDDYVNSDGFLRSLVGDNSENMRRIISPLQAKGLEWERVVVYRFGEYALQNCRVLCEFLQSSDVETLDRISENDRFLVEYFLNKLYVAVTRPRTRLFLADSRRAMEKFWTFAKDPSFRATLLNANASMREWHSSDLGGFEMGRDESWDENRDSPTQMAEELERQGRTDGDAALLERAKYYFGIDGNQLGQERCRALIAELTDAFDEAAQIYAKLNDWSSALRCRWVRGEWSKIASAEESGVYIDESPEVETILSAARILDQDGFQRRDLEDIMDLFGGEQRQVFVGEQSYATGLDKFLANVMERLASVDFGSDSSWCGIPVVMEDALGELDVSNADLELRLAQVYHRSGDSQSAMRIWMQSLKRQPISGQDPVWAVEAMVASMGAHDRLKVHAQSGDHKGIAEAWLGIVNSEESILPDIVRTVVRVAEKGKDLAAPLDALKGVESDDRWIHAAVSLGSEFDDVSKQRLGLHVITILVNRLALSKDWKRIGEFCAQDLRPLEPLHEIRRVWHLKRRGVLAIAADVLARSIDIQSGPPEDKILVRRHVVRRYLWQDEGGGGKSRKAPPDLRIVLEWLGEVRVLAAVVEGVCSHTEAKNFYTKLQSTLNNLGAPDADRQFARQRWAFCAAQLRKPPASLEQFLTKWNISVSELSESVELPAVEEGHYERLLCGQAHSQEPPPSGADSPPPGDVRASPDRSEGEDRQDSMISVRTELVIRIGNRVLNGEIGQVKERILLRDAEGNLVVCGPDRVDSPDLRVDLVKGGAQSRWQIPDWGIQCLINVRQSGRTVQFSLASGPISPKYVFETVSQDK